MVNKIKNFFHEVDNRNWKQVNEMFSSKVLYDYTSFGGKKEEVPSEAIICKWITFLPGFDTTEHKLSNVKSKNYQITADVVATHIIEDRKWIVEGSYEIKYIHNKITEFKFNLLKESGDTNLPSEAVKRATPKIEKISFDSKGTKIIGNLYYPLNFDKNNKYPTIIVNGSWTTVKEQMAHNYALILSRLGFLILTYDSRGFGESEGEPRFYENPDMKIEDISSAVTYLETLDFVDNIGALGICAGGGYTFVCASKDDRIKSVVGIATWIHDAEGVKLFYGGEEGVNQRIKASQLAEKRYKEEGVVEYIPTYSQLDVASAMYDPNNWYDYYNNSKRGDIKEWSKDKFAVMSWEKWLTYNPRPSAKELKSPTLMIHSDGCVLPEYAKKYFEDIVADKKLIWLDVPENVIGMHQLYFYDQESEVSISAFKASEWFLRTLIIDDEDKKR